MSTPQEVEAAKERMSAAKDALLAYTQRPDSQPSDQALYSRLVEEVKRAMDEFLRLASELRPS